MQVASLESIYQNYLLQIQSEERFQKLVKIVFRKLYKHEIVDEDLNSDPQFLYQLEKALESNNPVIFLEDDIFNDYPQLPGLTEASIQDLLQPPVESSSTFATKYEQFSCQLCHNMMIQAVQLSPCSCLICLHCLTQVIQQEKKEARSKLSRKASFIVNSSFVDEARRTFDCPVCSKKANSFDMKQEISDEIQNNYQFTCMYQPQCKFEGKIDEIVKHLQVCEHHKNYMQQNQQINDRLLIENQQRIQKMQQEITSLSQTMFEDQKILSALTQYYDIQIDRKTLLENLQDLTKVLAKEEVVAQDFSVQVESAQVEGDQIRLLQQRLSEQESYYQSYIMKKQSQINSLQQENEILRADPESVQTMLKDFETQKLEQRVNSLLNQLEEKHQKQQTAAVGEKKLKALVEKQREEHDLVAAFIDKVTKYIVNDVADQQNVDEVLNKVLQILGDREKHNSDLQILTTQLDDLKDYVKQLEYQKVFK